MNIKIMQLKITSINMNKKMYARICAAILGLFVLAYNWVWFNKTFTLSEGWSVFYVELMNRGKVPYKDFYYFLPPLSLFEDWAIWKFSFGYFIIYRFWRLLQRVLLVEFIYYIISKRVHPIIAFLSGILSTILLSANVYDLCGDYNQTQQFLVILMGYILLKYVDSVKNNSSKKYVWTTIVGAIGGLMFLQKQTVVLASAIIFGLLLVVFVIIKFEKNLIKTFASVVLGSLIPIIPTVIYLAVNKALKPFIYQVYQDTSSKGGLFEIVFGKLGKVLADHILLIIIAVGIMVALRLFNKSEKNNVPYIIIAVGCCFAGILVEDFFADLVDTIANIEFKGNHSIITSFYNEGVLLAYMTKFTTSIFLCIFVWIVYHIIDCRIEKKEYDLHALVLAFTAIVAGYSSIMANGESDVSVITAFIVVPVAFYLLFKDKSDVKNIKVQVWPIVGVIAVIFIICITQKLVCPYSWWGNEEASYWEKTETVDIRALSGYRFSKEEKAKFEKLNELISYYTDNESVIWGFPYVKVYNIFQDNYNMNGFVPVEFYDVCADDFAKKEAKLLAKNEPDIVVWVDIPNCMELHEKIYRNGKPLGQRAIQKWFSEVKDTDYTLIGQVDDVYIYKLNDDRTIDYKYITRKSKHNETSVYPDNSKYNGKLILEGDGTDANPYLIQCLEDFEYFRDEVNAGNSFKDCYIKQTCDIKLNSDENWVPIGHDVSNQFSGVYDGNGYSISGLYMLSDNDEDLGLFGCADGTIVNLTVKDAWVGGQNVALIVCKGNEGTVINCYASGILYGYAGGGVVYDINGQVSNCVGMVNVEKGEISGISGNYTNDIQNCYSNLADGIDIDSGEIIDTSTIEKLNEFVDNYNKHNNDIVLLKWENVDGVIGIAREE